MKLRRAMDWLRLLHRHRELAFPFPIRRAAPELTASTHTFLRRAQDHLALALRTEFPCVGQKRRYIWIEPSADVFKHFRQANFVDDLDAVLLCQLFCLAGVATKCDKNALLNFGSGQRTQKLPHRLHPDLACFPLLALYGRALAILLDHEINATVWICTATASDGVAEFAVKQGDQFFKLKPVNSPQLLY